MERYRQALVDHFKRRTRLHECEYRLRDRAGKYQWVLDHGIAVRNADGRAVRLVGAVSDITARKAAEQALRESEERYALAMRAINEGVYARYVQGVMGRREGLDLTRFEQSSPRLARTALELLETRAHP